MERISEDALTEILSRLSVKSLMRLKCVSKRWCSLISSPSFAKLHLKNQVSTNIGSASSSCWRIIKSFPTQSIDYEAFDGDDDLENGKEAVRLLSFPSYDPAKDSDWATLIGSCNGLVCLAVESDFILCNPCTGKSRKLLNSGLIPYENVVCHFWGFGYDVISDDYKILHGARFSDVSTQSVSVVFSLKSNSWGLISHELADKAYLGGVYFNGALHWKICGMRGYLELDSILSFDLTSEKFKNVIPTPKADNGRHFEDLGIHEGCLFVYNVTWQFRFEAWIMKEYGNGDSSWIKWFDVSTDGLPWYMSYVKLIACTKSGKIVCQVDERMMILFNPEDQTFKKIPVRLNDGFQPMATYIESLISPFD